MFLGRNDKQEASSGPAEFLSAGPSRAERCRASLGVHQARESFLVARVWQPRPRLPPATPVCCSFSCEPAALTPAFSTAPRCPPLQRARKSLQVGMEQAWRLEGGGVSLEHGRLIDWFGVRVALVVGQFARRLIGARL